MNKEELIGSVVAVGAVACGLAPIFYRLFTGDTRSTQKPPPVARFRRPKRDVLVKVYVRR